jgi:recombinational DNA repair ATPase RecF
VAEELIAARALASERLAATVGAIENIRLDLLRLQMGNSGIDSVTASLDAARQIGQQISESIDAQREVERLLRRAVTGPLREAPSAPTADDDDADTPVSGVPATRG